MNLSAASPRAPACRKAVTDASSATVSGSKTDLGRVRSSGLNSHQGSCRAWSMSRGERGDTFHSKVHGFQSLLFALFGCRACQCSFPQTFFSFGGECGIAQRRSLRHRNTRIVRTMSTELVAHAIFSFVAGLSIAVTGFGCDATRELFAVLSQGPNAFPASSAINMGLSAGLVTAVQAGDMHRVVLLLFGERVPVRKLPVFSLLRCYSSRFVHILAARL